MAEERVQRKLAAIMAADVVGYSRLMGEDETGTLAALKQHRTALIDPTIAQHQGRIVKLMGDGMLVEFGSVVDAVECAVNIQRGMVGRNADTLDSRRITFRIGVNLGDIIIDEDDIYGDGVNVAARLEGLAEPSGVCVSGTVFEHVKGKLDLSFDDLGPREVKNIAEPVRAYKVIVAPVADVNVKPESMDTTPPSRDKPSIAVLPFDNMSGDPEQEFFTDGLAEDIITALSKIERMRVIARNSSFAYRNQAVDLRRVAEELGVRYVLEGSVRRGGNRLRITAQLIDADDGSHMWAERYDRPVDDLFDIQDEMTKEIVTALRVKLTDGEVARVWARGTNNIEAWQFSVRAMELIRNFDPSGFPEARTLAERATELDPDYAYAWSILGWVNWMEARFGVTEDSEAKFTRANEFAEKAMALDGSVSWGIGLSAMVAGPLGRYDEGVEIARRGIELHPSNADVRAFLGFVLTNAGHNLAAEEQFRAAISLNPHYPQWYRGSLARALLFLDEFGDAETLLNEALEINPTYFPGLIFRAYLYGQTGRDAEATKDIATVRRIAPELTCHQMPGFLLIRDEAAINRFIDGMRKAGLPEG
jgi:adenylate cyclase